ncbi:glutathione S-transferase A2 [Prionailurus iriomotensis]
MESLSMAGKPKLHYFNGQGRMESIRWLLAAAGVEFEEELFETRKEFEKLIQVIDMYVEALKDLSDMIMFFPLSLTGEKAMNLEYILERATTRFFPVYEKLLEAMLSK